ncbi:fimbrial protein [Photorhabdus bodei]|uniref:Fimbrial protein n=1 Tax=Photorhabdus bodei TaxID=2029681 RepID=A0AAW6BEB1_9GAMM|nr:fimbrial protein [Photorhabdus bodei]MDB6371758.1 fimbrial protein [Photorhabdus bodei]
MFGTATEQKKSRLNDPSTFLPKGRNPVLQVVMRCFCWGSVMVLLFLASSVMADDSKTGPKYPPTITSGVDVILRVSVFPDPCDIEIGGGDMKGSELNFGSLLAAEEFSHEGDVSAPKSFKLKLTNCGDPESLGLTPRITVSGNTIDGEYGSIFSDPSSGDSGTSEGLGFIILIEENEKKKIGLNDHLSINHQEMEFPFQVEFDEGSVEMYVMVAIARGRDSKIIQPGTLIAHVTFTYSYP